MKVGLRTEFKNERMTVPYYEHKGDSGMDVRFNGEPEDVIYLLPGRRILLETGLWPSVPRGHELQVRAKSGKANDKGLCVLNGPGTVDSSFQGEIKVILYNASVSETVVIRAGEKIAQIVLCPVEECQWDLGAEVEKSTRGAGGFGSTPD